MKSVAIVGGGITGLTAAFRLLGKGIPVTLYEAGGRCGGVIQTVQRDGFVAETGPNAIMETSPLITTLVRDLGLESSKIYSSPEAKNRYILRAGQPIPLPGSPLEFARTRLFSTNAKLRLLREPFIRRAQTEEDLATFVLRRLGQEFLDYAINPFVAGIFAGDPHRLSVRYAFPKLHALEQRYGSLILGQILGAPERRRRGEVSKQNALKFSFTGGLSTLTQTLEHQLTGHVQLHTTVKALERTLDGWELTFDSPEGSNVVRHDVVLLAAPAHKLAQMELHGCPGVSLEELRKLPYSPVATVALGFRREDVQHSLEGFGILIPEIEQFSILGTIFGSSLFPNRAPAGHVLLTSYVGGARAPHLTGRSSEELVQLTLTDLRKMLGAEGAPVFRNVAVYPKAIPQYEMDFGAWLEKMNQIEAGSPYLFLAGHFRDGTSLSDSMLAGHKAADRIAAALKLEQTTASPYTVAA